MEKRYGALVVGSINVDIIQKVPYFPKIGESMPAEDATFCAGGKGANQAAQCAKLGIPTILMGWIGKDFFGDFLMRNLIVGNLDLRHVYRTDAMTAFAIVNTLPDKRLFAIVSKGANHAVTEENLIGLDDLLEKTEVLILQLEIPTEIVEYCIRKARKHGVKICLNAAPSLPLRFETIAACDYFIANEAEASYYVGEEITTLDDAKRMILPFAKTSRNTCIFTLGSNGSVVSNGTEVFYVPAYPTTVKETTGAGDSYIGGFIKGILEGFSLQKSAMFAARCSAVTIRNVGGISSMPTIEIMQPIFDEICKKKDAY